MAAPRWFTDLPEFFFPSHPRAATYFPITDAYATG